tara:strand:+ start:1060 stop:1203 length:144 start_codon:yes stop_codon:yes gene_type:complete
MGMSIDLIEHLAKVIGLNFVELLFSSRVFGHFSVLINYAYLWQVVLI